MALKADKEGFLVGERVSVDRGSFDKAIAVWRSVQTDVRAIRKAVVGERIGAARMSVSRARPVMSDRQVDSMATRIASAVRTASVRTSSPRSAAAARVMPARDAQGRFVRAAPAVIAGRAAVVPAAPVSGPSSSPAVPEQNKTVPTFAKTAERDAGGRFTSGGRDGGGDARSAEALMDAAKSLKDSANGLMDGTEDIDPAIKASKEVAEMVGPVLGPLGGLLKGMARGLFGGKDKAVPWYRRIVNELRNLNQNGEKSGGIFRMMLMALMALPALLLKLPALILGGIGKRVMASALLGGAARLLGGAGGAILAGGKSILGRGKDAATGALGKAGGIAGKAAKFGGGLLRKVPLIGTLLGAGMVANAAFGADDPSKSAGENRMDRFKQGGAGAGSMIGAAIGALGGPLGMIAGGIIGDIVGEKVGAWLGTVNWGAVGQQMTATWTAGVDTVKGWWQSATTLVGDSFKAVSDGIGKRWDAIGTWFEGIWKPIADVFGAAGKWLSDKLGVVIEPVKQVVQKVGDLAQSAKSGALETFDRVKSAGGAVMEKLSGRAGDRKAALIREMNAAGIKDLKEQAMFMAQMDHESGGFTATEESFKYRSADRIMDVSKTARGKGKAAVEAAMAQGPQAVAELMYGGRMGNVNPGDAYKFRGRGATQLTGRANYEAAGKALGIDLLKNPDLVANDPTVSAKVATWFWKQNGLGGKARAGDVTGVTKGINGGTNGLADRKEKYAEYLAVAGKGGLSVATPAMANGTAGAASAAPMMTAGMAPKVAVSSASVPAAVRQQTVPSVAKATPSAAAPEVRVPLASNKGDKKTVAVVRDPVGQNVRDRSIAQVATGGIGGGA